MSVEVSDVNLMESPPDKVVLVGDVGVGKTSLFLRFKTGEFSESTTHNPREGEYHKEWQLGGSDVSVSRHVASILNGISLSDMHESGTGILVQRYSECLCNCCHSTVHSTI